MVKYDLNNVQLLLLPLVVKTSRFVALYVWVSRVCLIPKWIGSLCLCSAVYRSQQAASNHLSRYFLRS
jgi:hypothetical protein